MNNQELLREVENNMKYLQEVREDLRNLQNENVSVFESYDALVLKYNELWDACKNLLKAVETDQALRVGPFSRDRKSYTTKFKPNLLPAEILGMPGVVKTVDDKVIADLVTRGLINQSDIESARYEYSRTPAVRSPLERVTLPTLVDVQK